LVLGLADGEEEGFCFVEGRCNLGLRDAKLLFGKDGFRLSAGILERDNPHIRYLDPLASGSKGEHVAHATLVHAHPETLEALVDVSYLLARGWPQAPQGDIGESYNRHVRLFSLAPV